MEIGLRKPLWIFIWRDFLRPLPIKTGRLESQEGRAPMDEQGEPFDRAEAEAIARVLERFELTASKLE